MTSSMGLKTILLKHFMITGVRATGHTRTRESCRDRLKVSRPAAVQTASGLNLTPYLADPPQGGAHLVLLQEERLGLLLRLW